MPANWTCWAACRLRVRVGHQQRLADRLLVERWLTQQNELVDKAAQVVTAMQADACDLLLEQMGTVQQAKTRIALGIERDRCRCGQDLCRARAWDRHHR